MQGYKLIPLNGKYGRDKFAIVDADDYEELRRHNWHLSSTGHVVRYENGRAILMHRVIMCAQLGMEIDHINGIPADNRRENLRQCSHAENMRNKRVRRSINKKSKYKGVSKGDYKSWRAEIKVNGNRHKLGSYKSEDDAARMYDAAARYYHGEFARTNFPGNLALSKEEIRGIIK